MHDARLALLMVPVFKQLCVLFSFLSGGEEACIRPNGPREREIEMNAQNERKTTWMRQQHYYSDHASVSGALRKAASNTQECKNVHWCLSHQVGRLRQAWKSVSFFCQEVISAAGPFEDSNSTSQGYKGITPVKQNNRQTDTKQQQKKNCIQMKPWLNNA